MTFKRFKIRDDIDAGEYRLTELLPHITDSEVLQRAFRSKEVMCRVLKHIKVRIDEYHLGVWLDSETVKIYMGKSCIFQIDENFLYLDVIHLIIHIKQLLQGKELFDHRFDYTNRPTELEAYRYTIEEAKRIGMDGDDIVNYLRIKETDDIQMKRMMEKIWARI